jgi:hypothetical protein
MEVIEMETKSTMPMVQVELPAVLLKRADLQTVGSARELITFLLERYAQELEHSQQRQAYADYYAARTPEEEAEEISVLADFSVADVAICDEDQ